MARKLIVLALVFMAVVGLASANGSPTTAPSPSASSRGSDAELTSPPAPALFETDVPMAETPMAEDEPAAPLANDKTSGAAALTVSAAAASAAIAGFFL